MTIGVLGTGMVGRTIATKLIDLGHEVIMGSRSPDNEVATAWAREAGARASRGTFAAAAAQGELLFNCARGEASLQVLESAGKDNLRGKILVDVSNPLDFSGGMPPTLSVLNDDSLAESIQRAFPEVKVVKALNTVNCAVMVDPGRVPGEHTVFLSGNEDDAKGQVRRILTEGFGWKDENVLDLGDITTARGTEMYLPLWLRIWSATRNGNFNIHVVFGDRG